MRDDEALRKVNVTNAFFEPVEVFAASEGDRFEVRKKAREIIAGQGRQQLVRE